jgi:multidrug efflux pump subunit AcrA (membrane-fusion protein)
MKRTSLTNIAVITMVIAATTHSAIAEDNPDIGIKYDKKQGLYVTPFSAKLLGFEKADVEERIIASTFTLQAQVFDVSPEGKALASARVPQEDLSMLAAGMAVAMERGFSGKISSVKSAINGQGEVLIEIADKGDALKMGKFLTGKVVVSTDGEVVVVPRAAVVKSAEGSFAYVDNGGWMTRAQVETGAEEDGMVEIIDGLYAGDIVAISPVMTLWMTELQLLKSGRA